MAEETKMDTSVMVDRIIRQAAQNFTKKMVSQIDRPSPSTVSRRELEGGTASSSLVSKAEATNIQRSPSIMDELVEIADLAIPGKEENV